MNSEDRAELARLYDDSPDTIGAWGELITASTLRQQLNIRVVNTLYIGGSQIDMVALSPHGVFIIENKNYHGVVLGRAESQYWRVFYTPVRSYKLYNPIFQNRKHLEDVRKMLALLGYPDIPLYCPVIFNDFAVLRLHNTDRVVYTLSDFILRYSGYKEDAVIDDDVLLELYNLFMKYQDRSDEAKAAHVASKRFG